MSIHAGAGSVVSTPTDMVKFIEALFRYKPVNSYSLVKMTTIVDGIGMGLFELNHGSKHAFGHNGRIEEFYSSVSYFPKQKLAVAYITNGIIYPRTDIIDAVLKVCFNESFSMPFSAKPTFTLENIDKLTGSYSSKQPPIVVNCSSKKQKLLIETKGTIFELEPLSDTYFMHKPTGYFFEFSPYKRQLLIKEADEIYYLNKDN